MSNIFVIETKSTHYALGVDERGLVHHLHWGEKINPDDYEVPKIWDTNSNYSDLDNARLEYTVFGGKMYRSCAFKCTYADGCRDSVFAFEKAEQDDSSLSLTLVDKAYDIRLVLHYLYSKNSDVITRIVEVKNDSKNDIVLNKIASCELNLPSIKPYYLQNTNGSWGAEFQAEDTLLETGTITFESRKGTVGHTNQPSFVAHQNATEDDGEVFYGALGYGGNFKVECSRDYRGITRVHIGVSDFDFSHSLKAGESFVTPKMYIGKSTGFAKMSNDMSRFVIENVLPKSFAKKPLPVLYNSWEATEFDVNTADQLKLAKIAKQIGCELFVMDDGWFGKRNNDRAGLGDWFVNKDKFPNGIDELINGVNELGMDFGLWFEPEMVQADSDLYRAHPDWIYHYSTRKSSELRHQLVLNLTKPEVKQYVFDCMDKMLEKHNIRYIKWDMNRPFSEIGAENLENPQELWYRHTMAVYEIADQLKEKYPYLQLEACSSGGGRAELGALEHFDMVWTSDNTDPYDRLIIQNGFARLYPVKCMRAWVTDVNKKHRTLDYRFVSSMQGSLSIGSRLDKYTDEELRKATDYIAQYKDIRDIVQFGDMYRLAGVRQDDFNAVEYVKGDRAVVFICGGAGSLFNRRFKKIKLKGLKNDTNYTLTFGSRIMTKSGAYFGNVGVEFEIEGPFYNKILDIRKAN